MNLSNFWQCCFPKNKNIITRDKNEENYDFSHTSDEKTNEKTNENIKKGNNSPLLGSKLFKIKKDKENFECGKTFLDIQNKDIGLIGFGTKVDKISVNKSANKDNITNNLTDMIGEGDNQIDRKHISANYNYNVYNGSNRNAKSIDICSNTVAKLNISKQKDDLISEIDSGRVITDEDIKKAPEIILEEITGCLLRNNKLIINAAGLSTGLRKARDGLVFFGFPSNVANDECQYYTNDLELDYIDNRANTNRLFLIYYKKETNKYYLKNYNKTRGIMHIKICSNYPYAIIKKEVILLNDYYFQLVPYSDGKLEMSDLGFASTTGKKRSDIDSNSKYLFDKNENDTFTIGRNPKCSVSFPNDKSFSKIHTTLCYDADKNIWFINDGEYNRPSTNGTWIYASHSFEIHDNTLFQFGNSNFQIIIKK